MIVVVSNSADEHARAVLTQLRQQSANALLMDLSQFPQHLALAINYESRGVESCLRQQNCELQLDDWRAIWWRRPSSFGPHPMIRRQAHCDFVYSECSETFAGLWHLIDAAWMNHPKNDEMAARKVLQLKVARAAGLETPRTLITNDPARARSFIDDLGPGRVVYKAFSATPTDWRETRLVGDQELELLDHVRYAPVIFQEYIEAQVDVRITIVHEKLFPAAIHSQASAYKVDFRMDMIDTCVEAVSLPLEVVAGLRELMRRLGLIYGAVDMRKTLDGRYVFLEINPAGQWLFIEERTKQPITAAVAHTLMEMDSGQFV